MALVLCRIIKNPSSILITKSCDRLDHPQPFRQLSSYLAGSVSMKEENRNKKLAIDKRRDYSDLVNRAISLIPLSNLFVLDTANKGSSKKIPKFFVN